MLARLSVHKHRALRQPPPASTTLLVLRRTTTLIVCSCHSCLSSARASRCWRRPPVTRAESATSVGSCASVNRSVCARSQARVGGRGAAREGRLRTHRPPHAFQPPRPTSRPTSGRRLTTRRAAHARGARPGGAERDPMTRGRGIHFGGGTLRGTARAPSRPLDCVRAGPGMHDVVRATKHGLMSASWLAATGAD